MLTEEQIKKVGDRAWTIISLLQLTPDRVTDAEIGKLFRECIADIVIPKAEGKSE